LRPDSSHCRSSHLRRF